MGDQRVLENPQPFLKRPGFNDIKNLPSNGLYHSIEKLNEVFRDPDIKTKSVVFLADYADYVTRGSLNQEWFKNDLRESLPTVLANPYYKYTLTAIGGIAFGILNTSDEKLKLELCTILDYWRNDK